MISVNFFVLFLLEHLKGKRHRVVAKLSLLHVATVHSRHEHYNDDFQIPVP